MAYGCTKDSPSRLIRHNARVILSCERVILNFLQRMSGIATLTRKFVEAVAGTKARILDTRKTAPGLRVIDKYAVRCGGGQNHRLDLSDGVLIKNNHIALAGGIAPALERAHRNRRGSQPIEVEVRTIDELELALANGAEAILLDNMSPKTCAGRSSVARKLTLQKDGRRIPLECSGGIRLENVRAYAETGVDFISSAYLTHSPSGGRYEHARRSLLSVDTRRRISIRLSFGLYSRIISASPTPAKLAASHVPDGIPAAHQPHPPTCASASSCASSWSIATVVLSGTKIAEEISSSRSEVWRLIQQLRGLGVDVAGHPATGYSLRPVPDLLLPEILRPLLRGTIFDTHINHFYKIGSTNTAAMAAAAEGSPEGSVFLAEEQTAGRGRGGQHLAIAALDRNLLFRDIAARAAAVGGLVLSLAAGLAVRSAIHVRRFSRGTGSEVAQRLLDRRQESLRHSDGNECRSDACALHRRGNRHQREPGRFPARLLRWQRRCVWRLATNGRGLNWSLLC